MKTETTIKLYNVFNKLQYKYAKLGGNIYSNAKVDLFQEPEKELLEIGVAIDTLIETYDNVILSGEEYPFFGVISDHKLNQLLDKLTVYFSLDPVPYLDFPNNTITVSSPSITVSGSDGSNIDLPSGGGPGFYLSKDSSGNYVWRSINSIESDINGTRLQLINKSKAEWGLENPVLRKGEIGLEIEQTGSSIISARSKVGNGTSRWDLLPYADQDYYPYSDLTSQEFDGIPLNSSLQGRRVVDILRDITSPYKKPSIQNFRIDGKSKIELEVGTQLSSSYQLTWGFDFENNVRDDESGLLTATNSQAFQNLGNLNLKDKQYQLTGSLFSLQLPGKVTIRLNGQDIKGSALNQRSIDIEWLGNVMYGVQSQAGITTANQIRVLQNEFLANRQRLQKDYNFSNGYCFIAVPEFIDVSGIKFIDNDNNLNFSFETQNNWDSALPELVNFDNGFTQFNYRIFRGENFYNSSINIRIEF